MIAKHLGKGLLAVYLTMAASPALAGEPPTAAAGTGTPAADPATAALARLEKLRPRKMGVDRAGNLWVWGGGLGTVTLISPAGLDLGTLSAPGALTVDVDGEWGAVAFFLEGNQLRWLSANGDTRAAVRLGEQVADVCWIGPGLVAVTPEMADHRIEIWDLDKRALVKTLGAETPLHPALGAIRMRAVILRYDFENGLLYSLESFTGDLQVFDREGKLAWRASVENPRRPQMEKWLQEVDATAKARQDEQTPLVFNLRLGLSPQGEPWVLQSADDSTGTVTLGRVLPSGVAARLLPVGGCSSYDFVFWRSRLVTFRVPESPEGICVGWISFP